MSDFKELKDEELREISGGYNGTLPQGGIVFESYPYTILNRYYSSGPNTNEVVWFFQKGMVSAYTKENFVVDTKNNTWKSTGISDSIIVTDYTAFHNKYPFILSNIRP